MKHLIDEFELLSEVRPRLSAPIFVWVPLTILALAATITAGWFYRDNLRLEREINDPIGLAQSKEDALVAAVGERIELPTGERPTFIVVTDLKQVKDQSFFTNARVGDVTLIYAAAQEAILYRPSTKRVITVGPVSATESAKSTGPLAPISKPSTSLPVTNGMSPTQ